MEDKKREVYSVSDAQFSFIVEASPQIHRLLEIHRQIGGSGRGRRRNLEMLNKSAIVLTCAFWEAFIEDLAAETLLHFTKKAESADALPKELKKSIVSDLNVAKHELAVWNLAGDGWRDILRQRATTIKSTEDRTLNTPTSANVETFFNKQAGIPDLTNSWRWAGVSASTARERLDKFVDLRNKIAHRGGPVENSVLKKDAQDGISLIERLANCSLKHVNTKTEEYTGIKLIPNPIFI